MESTDYTIEVSEADEDEARRYFALWALGLLDAICHRSAKLRESDPVGG